MKKLYTGILGVALVLCLTSATSYSQTIPNWAPNTAYAVGALVMYQNIEYKCIQAHTSQVGWEPPNVPALWSPVSGSPTPTPTPTPTATPTPTLPTPTPPPGGGGTCAPAWNSTLAYCNTSTTTCNGGNKASKNGLNFTAQFWNQGQDPTDCRQCRSCRLRRSVVYGRRLHHGHADAYSNSHSNTQTHADANSASAGQRDLRGV